MSMAERSALAGTTSQGDQVLQWVTFELEGETYGIDVMAVKEVLRYQEIAPVPGSPAYVLGIINIRGKVISVISTRRRFNLPDAAGDAAALEQARIMIVEIGDYVIGIVVDSVAEVVYLKQSQIDSTPATGQDDSARFIQGLCNRGDQLLILLDLGKMISQDELAEIDQR